MSNDGPLGSLAEEARRLAEAMHSGAAGVAGHPPGSASAGTGSGEQESAQADPTTRGSAGPADSSQQHPPTCTWCPLCRGVESLRAVDPDGVERLVDAIAALAAVLGDLSEQLRPRGAPTHRVPHRDERTQGRDGTAYDIPVLEEDGPEQFEGDDRGFAADSDAPGGHGEEE